MDNIKEFLETFRQDIEEKWDDQTVSPKFLPIKPSKPRSLGQCTPTSWVLLKKLRETFPNEKFLLAIGEVRLNFAPVIPYHVWIIQVTESPKKNKIIDVTADQSGVLKPIVYREIKELAAEAISYISYEQSPDGSFVHDEARARAKLLEERYGK